MSNYDHLKQQIADMRTEREAWEARMAESDANRSHKAYQKLEKEYLQEKKTTWQLAALHTAKRLTLRMFDALETRLSK